MTATVTALRPSLPALRPAPARPSNDGIGIRTLERVIGTVARAGSAHPGADPAVYGVKTIKDVPYRAAGDAAHSLDVYMPADRQGPLPVVLYVHGGGFRLMSKDTHWMMAIAFARRGYLVLNVNYRLSPQHAFPAALQDVSDAWLWALRNVERYGGDPDRIVVAGESAGGNLVTALAIETTFERPEPWAKRVFEAGVVPAAVVAYCGILEVSGIERLLSDRWYPGVVKRWIRSVETAYLDGADASELADPVRILEGDASPVRPLPPFFASVGGSDPLADDTVRLEAALLLRGVEVEAHTYDGEGHAFQMLTWRKAAKASWKATFEFLSGHITEPPRLRALGRVGRVRERIIDAIAA